MIVLKSTQDKVLAALQSVSGIVERRHTLPILANTLMARNGFPEAGGGGAAASIDHAPHQTSIEVTDGSADATGSDSTAPAASDDDDGGDDEGDPDRRHSPRKKSPSGRHRNATATAGDLSFPKHSDIALWRLPTVLQHVPISRSGWWAGVKAGRYPAPVRLSTRCVAWKSEDIRALINSL